MKETDQFIDTICNGDEPQYTGQRMLSAAYDPEKYNLTPEQHSQLLRGINVFETDPELSQKYKPLEN